MPPAQDHRFRQLAGAFEAVATTPLPNGYLVLSCRSSSDPDKVAHVEVIDQAGQSLPFDEVLRILGAARQDALALADRATAQLIDFVALLEANGQDVNLSAVARQTGINRQTFYNRRDAASVTTDLSEEEELAAGRIVAEAA